MSIVNRYKTKPGEKEQIDKQNDKHNLLIFFNFITYNIIYKKHN